MTKQSEEDLAEEEDKQSPLFYPPAPPDELFDVATTVDPGYVISLIRKILPPNVVECYYSNDENIYEDLVQPSKSDDMELTVLSPTTNNGLGKYESKNNSGDLFEKSEILSREQAWEESGCILWDLAASETHAEFMVENLILEVLLGNLNFNHHVRAKEITLGIVGNLACHKGSMNHIVSSKGLIEIIVDQLFVDDTPCLCEACRVLTLGVRGDQSVKWVDVLQNQDVLIRLLWVAENTLHPQLIEKSVRLLLGLVECNLPSASSIHATLMNLGLSQLLINLLSFEIRTFMNERLSERYAAMESILCAIEALSVTDDYSSKICSNEELFKMVYDLVKFPDKSEVSSQCVTAAVLLANMLMDELDFASGIYHDLTVPNGLFDMLPFVSDDADARNAIWSTVSTWLKTLDGYSHNNKQLVMLLTSKVEVIEDDLLNQQHHSSSNSHFDSSIPINASLGRIMRILSEWSNSSQNATCTTSTSGLHCQVSRLSECCHRFYMQIST